MLSFGPYKDIVFGSNYVQRMMDWRVSNVDLILVYYK